MADFTRENSFLNFVLKIQSLRGQRDGGTAGLEGKNVFFGILSEPQGTAGRRDGRS